MRKPKLLDMLSYCRPAWSKGERDFISRYLDPIPGMYSDKYGNRLLVNPDSKVIIACHTDTVHRESGRQKVIVREGMAMLPQGSGSNCLGADDTAGLYAALRMIDAGVPATYIFHRAEEIGGWGSDWLALNHSGWLKQHDICLSLDRRGTMDIITDQWTGNTASDTFAWSLADQLGMDHSPARGIFTDSANYAHLIPECSNLSIGYYNEHTALESLDTVYLEQIIARLIKVDWTKLSISRDCAADSLLDFRISPKIGVDKTECEFCGHSYPDSEMNYWMEHDGHSWILCPKCYEYEALDDYRERTARL